MSINNIANKLSKSVSNQSLLYPKAVSHQSLFYPKVDPNKSRVILSDSEDPPIKKSVNPNGTELNLISFTRMFRFGNLPIIDFIVVYLILYVINKSYLRCDYQHIFALTILIVIGINILDNKTFRFSKLILILIIISVSYLVW
jgi:hypothetical protein